MIWRGATSKTTKSDYYGSMKFDPPWPILLPQPFAESLFLRFAYIQERFWAIYRMLTIDLIDAKVTVCVRFLQRLIKSKRTIPFYMNNFLISDLPFLW